jgi:hypothetical protein
MLAPTITKADELAVERLLRRAVERAVAELRAITEPDGFAYAYERNVDRFHVAIRAAELIVPQGVTT